MRLKMLGFMAVISLAGCGESAQTVDWYVAHQPERDKLFCECLKNPGELDGAAKCVNAKMAAYQVQKTQLKEQGSAPPMASVCSPK